MAFLDNAGDIILDAVLTDAGRQRLARGNFKIVKFAFGDEEINYELFNSSHPSGSAFYDLEVMQTPILEAFTNNTSLMKSKLISINRNNILYMPILKVNNQAAAAHAFKAGFDGYYLTADEKTSTLNDTQGVITDNVSVGIMHGVDSLPNGASTKYIGVDQGIVSDGNTDGLSINDTLPADMVETAYLVRVDHRLLRLHAYQEDAAGKTGPELVNQFVDDDAIATYFFAQFDDTRTVFGARENAESGFRSGMRYKLDFPLGPHFETVRDSWEMFLGPIGTSLRLVPRAATAVQFSSALFDKLGTAATGLALYGANDVPNYKFIDTSINVTGITTGYSVDIPIRIVKGTY